MTSSPISSRRTTTYALFGVLAALSLTAATCSSTDADDSDDGSPTIDIGSGVDVGSGVDIGDEPVVPADDDDSVAATGDVDCDQLGAHAALIRGAGGSIPQIVDDETLELFEGDKYFDEIDAAVEGLRPIQDIDGVFGTVRQGLDNLAADVQAIREGRYDDKVGAYNTAGIGAVLGEEVCAST